MSLLLGILKADDLPALSRFRDRVGWEYCSGPEDGLLWIRVPQSDNTHFDTLPLVDRFTSPGNELIFQSGRQLPSYQISESNWRPLATLISIGKIARTAPGMPPFPVGFGLVKKEKERGVGAMLCDWNVFSQWSDTVLVQRINCLDFAIASDRKCLIKGNPLPGISGMGFYRDEQIWLPVGLALPDYLSASLLQSAMQVSQGASVFIFSSGDWDIVNQSDWVKGSRESVNINRMEGRAV